MNIFSSFLYSLQEDQVVLPPAAGHEHISECVEIVVALIERNRQVEARCLEEARKREEEERPTS